MTSELLSLLQKNAYGEGLNVLEEQTALELISRGEPGNEDCWICKMVYLPHRLENVEKSIYDLGICKPHAYYALVIQK